MNDDFREGFKNPSHGSSPLRGPPSPGPQKTDFERTKRIFLAERGGTPPPLAEFFCDFVLQKKTCL